MNICAFTLPFVLILTTYLFLSLIAVWILKVCTCMFACLLQLTNAYPLLVWNHPPSFCNKKQIPTCYCVCECMCECVWVCARSGLTKQSRGISIAGATKSFLPPSSLLPDPLSLTHMHTHLPTTELQAGSTVPVGGRRGQWEWRHKRPPPSTILPAKLQERSKPNCTHSLPSNTHGRLQMENTHGLIMFCSSVPGRI